MHLLHPSLHLCYKFFTSLFHICNTPHYIFVTRLLQPCFTFATPLLHFCDTSFIHLLHIFYTPRYTFVTHLLLRLLHLRYTVVVLFVTISMHPYTVAFFPCLICEILSCGILSEIHPNSYPNTPYYTFVKSFLPPCYTLVISNCKDMIMFQ